MAFCAFCLHQAFPSSYKDTIVGSRPTQKTSSKLDYICKDRISEQDHIRRYKGVGIRHIFCGGTQFNP